MLKTWIRVVRLNLARTRQGLLARLGAVNRSLGPSNAPSRPSDTLAVEQVRAAHRRLLPVPDHMRKSHLDLVPQFVVAVQRFTLLLRAGRQRVRTGTASMERSVAGLRGTVPSLMAVLAFF